MDDKLRVAIAGATGYTGCELIRLLSKHKNVKITWLTSEEFVDLPLEKVAPSFKDSIFKGFIIRSLKVEDLIKYADVVFLALPHTVSMKIVPDLFKEKKIIIDLSADFRLEDPKIYEKYYLTPHKAESLIKKAVYGLPEIYKNKIKSTNLIANPGCYPTCAILGILPLCKNVKFNSQNIIIDAKSGVSGAGRKPKLDFHFPECNESLKAYSVLTHRHTPEIKQELSKKLGTPVNIYFVPHLIPISRGILCTIYIDLEENISLDDLISLYKNFYKDEPFIKIFEDSLPSIKDVLRTNYCAIGLKLQERKLVIVSAIDNLLKGASGQAIQNMNIRFNFDEKMALEGGVIFP